MADVDERVLLDRPDSRSSEDDALARLEAAGILVAIDRLTVDQRSVLMLRMLADLPIAEIAEVVGKPETAVKALLPLSALASLGRNLVPERVQVDGRA